MNSHKNFNKKRQKYWQKNIKWAILKLWRKERKQKEEPMKETNAKTVEILEREREREP